MEVKEGEYNLGSCSAVHECVAYTSAGRASSGLNSGSWAVGLGIFLACYVVFMIVAIWMYCKYCRKAPEQPQQQLVLKNESNCD